METKPIQPIRLTEGQTELLTKALLEAEAQGAKSKSGETLPIKKQLDKPLPSSNRPGPSAKKPMVI
jgi:hypothetical protein